MQFIPDNIYHVYNQGNNRELLFLNEKNYQYFLQLFNGYILPHCEVLSWCLMPNHFHFQLYMDERCTIMKKQGGLILDPVTNGFRKLLSAYAHTFNDKNDRSGSVFRPKTKAKCLSDEFINSGKYYSLADYYSYCFYYIHNNPIKDRLVQNPSDWHWSSYNFYFGTGRELICNRELAAKYCSFNIRDGLQGADLVNYIRD